MSHASPAPLASEDPRTSRRDLIKQIAACGTALALPAPRPEQERGARPVGRLHRPGGPTRHPDEQGRQDLLRPAQRERGRQRPEHRLRNPDDGYEPDRCKANTERFIKDEVFTLFRYVGTPTCLPALPLINEAKIPFFEPFNGAEALRDPFSRYVFHLRGHYYDETALIVKQLTSLGLNKIAVCYQNDSYGKAGLKGVTRALKALNLGPVATGMVERNIIDVAQAVSDIIAKQPNAVVQISAYKSCAAFHPRSAQGGFGGTSSAPARRPRATR